MSQRDIIAKLTDQELRKQVMISQFLLVAIAIFLSLFLFDSFTDWMHYFKWDLEEIVYFGMLPGILIVLIDILLFITLPHAAFDDGGINERLFKKQSVGFIFLLSFFVACSEELLFRGVIQTSFGYIIASILFALVHIYAI
ncbi:type II CAAX prenyl endopeptidase Rce1 family protein [Oceanobacillus kapialis]|uniref:CPBP family glutamic-type intramembrane protease n=1 Tax=Oceanobacillus kapialis TaxID=481353 RepID=UPI003850E9E9